MSLVFTRSLTHSLRSSSSSASMSPTGAVPSAAAADASSAEVGLAGDRSSANVTRLPAPAPPAPLPALPPSAALPGVPETAPVAEEEDDFLAREISDVRVISTDDSSS